MKTMQAILITNIKIFVKLQYEINFMKTKYLEWLSKQ